MNIVRVLITIALVASFCAAQVIQITDENFGSLIKNNDEWLLEFHAQWCGYCKRFEPKFYEAEKMIRSTSVEAQFGQVDTEHNPGLAARFFISRLPTLVHIKNGQVRIIDQRDPRALVELLEYQTWRDITPVKALISPFGLFGTLVGYIGLSVKYASRVSPWKIAAGLASLILMLLAIPFFFGSSENRSSQESRATTSAATPKSSTADSRPKRSKRID
ncbi:Thioredoxin- transmembrane protein 1 [Apophysomyces sp. BC1034]|nr:Thioredoxin- transmembrane protein 1 [Apophysomyces sp. BC1015]KAG0182221.1 Thioredoxin- transmembrane protein 1 [Apophysomyces sp. BC1021]KAG0192956.1 Thioredoxin- transmembrane protein 1 [Apophysomyces sp. BC1034]